MALGMRLKYLGVVVIATCPVWAVAQNSEPEWRVVNVEPAQAVPLVESPLNPFPQIKEEIKVAPQEVAVDPEAEARRAQLEGLKTYVENASLVAPDMSSIRVGGYMVGPRGGSALLNGKWIKVGDKFKVATSPRPDAVSTLQMLKAMRDGEADSMVERMESRMVSPEPVMLTVMAITEKQVDVSDGKTTYPLMMPRQRGF